MSVGGSAQVRPNHPATSEIGVVTDRILGISFLQIGRANGRSRDSYTALIESARGKLRQAAASVSVTVRPRVDLSGSFGGVVYLDDPRTWSVRDNIVTLDTISVGGVRFRREYWAVYAGMGAWEGVINCTALRNGLFYTLSMNAGMHVGKPGEVSNGRALRPEDLREQVVNVLCDSTEPVVQSFHELLASFQFLR